MHPRLDRNVKSSIRNLRICSSQYFPERIAADDGGLTEFRNCFRGSRQWKLLEMIGRFVEVPGLGIRLRAKI
jgi:hypothetical protein